MNQIILIFSLLALLIQTNPHRSILAAAAAADIVADTCKQIVAVDGELDYSLCLSLFNSAPGSHSADLKGLAKISIAFTNRDAEHVIGDINSLIEQEHDNTYMKMCLSTCKEIYDDAVSNLNNAANSIELGRIKDARIELSASFVAADTCEDGFSDGNIQSPLTKDDNHYISVARIPLAIAALLDN